jgi:hypothetical protein
MMTDIVKKKIKHSRLERKVVVRSQKYVSVVDEPSSDCDETSRDCDEEAEYDFPDVSTMTTYRSLRPLYVVSEDVSKKTKLQTKIIDMFKPVVRSSNS